MAKEYEDVADEKIMIRLGEALNIYFTDVKFMASYWKELLDYLKYDSTFIKLFIKTYNARYKLEEDIELSVEVRNSHMIEVRREVRKAILRNNIRSFWEK